MIEVRLDELPNGYESATVEFWFVEEGDRATESGKFVKLSMDGKPFIFTSPATGVVSEIYCDEGEEISLGEVIAVLEPEREKEEEVEELEEMD
ncbi:MAG: hypothetical protein HYS08_02345 [Chlamydiae bacterium]|nr:hypothetical protein [Chlamydiota bacterium]MBI3266716.1 hypothetical protein [Chlamydiota bacterium]